ncbi:MAG: nitronate monooxygenase, partial [Chlamydiota bacterium]
MWKENRIAKLCNIRFPIIQAPMAGITTPRLVAAVSNAGGLGSLGAAYLSPKEMRSAIQEIKSLTEAPFAVNLFAIPSPDKDVKKIQSAKRMLNRYCEELAIPPCTLSPSALP